MLGLYILIWSLLYFGVLLVLITNVLQDYKEAKKNHADMV